MINKLYAIKKGYFANYSSDLWISAGIIFTAFSISSFLLAKSSLKEVQADWAANRCKPVYIPFAGYLMPQPGKTTMEATAENLEYCLQSDFSSIGNVILMPLQFVVFLLVTTIDGIVTFLQSLMEFLGNIEKDLGILFEMIYQLILLVVIPVMVLFLRMRDILAKTNGVMMDGFYLLETIYNSLQSGILNAAVSGVDMLELLVVFTIPALLLVCFVMYSAGWLLWCCTLGVGVIPGTAMMAASVTLFYGLCYAAVLVYGVILELMLGLNAFVEDTFHVKVGIAPPLPSLSPFL